MSFTGLRLNRIVGPIVLVCLMMLCGGESVFAQSTNIELPTPVTANEISGRIEPRDIGDARLTRHFYTFKGREGDLIITVESVNLDGAVDLYVANNLRPLLKITLFPGSSFTRASKGVYLRKDESLILRVEARSIGDTSGSYKLKFDGAFIALSADESPSPETPPSPPATTASPATRRGGRRATSVGGRVEETAEEKAARAEAEAKERAEKEAAKAEEEERRAKRRAELEEAAKKEARAKASAAEKEAEKTGPTESARESKPKSSTPARTTRPSPSSSRPRTSRTRPSEARTRRDTPTTSEKRSETTAAATTERKEAAKASTGPEVVQARLVIETKDGSRIERSMTTVRRLTVENNHLVIVTSEGRIEKRPMADILRMSIEQ